MSERDELVARLNRADEYEPLGHDGWDAADQIKRDGREIERLREALRPFAQMVDKSSCEITVRWSDGDYISTYTGVLKPNDFYRARAALSKEKACE